MTSIKLLKIAIVIQLVFLPKLIFGQNKTTDTTVHRLVEQHTDQIFDSLIKIRRDFHSYPELSGEEKRTSHKIANYLTSLGLEVHTNIGGYGVVGILKTNKKGKRIAWRADIDALAHEVSETVEFQSKNKGVSHICGHDINATIGLGIADVLSSLKKNLNGTIYFVFQPSEENLKGAKAMINDGLFDIINPDEIYALHITPMPTGLIGTKSDWLFAGYKSIKVTYKNSSENDDIIAYSKEIISSLQNVKPDSKFWDNRNLLDPNIGLGNPNTIYKDYLTVAKKFKIEQSDNKISISTFISSSNEKKMDSVLSLLKEKIKASKYAEKLFNVAYSGEYPIISNNKQLTNKTMSSLSSIYGNQSINSLYGVIPDGRSDDFAYFQKRIPSVYFLLGGSNFEKGIISIPHSPNFAVDESCIKTGVTMFSSMIIERLKQ